jgi:hypothetical protein
MFVTLRHLFNKQLFIQSKLRIKNREIFQNNLEIGTCFIRYQSQVNVARLNTDFDENDQELGLFKHFKINEQTQERLKGSISSLNNNFSLIIF